MHRQFNNNTKAPYSSITAISYSISGSEQNRLGSSVEIENKDLFHGDLPAEGGVYDSHMGSTDKAWRCGTCGNSKGRCPGHCGHIELRYPVKNPMWRDFILKFLKVICFRCGRLIVTKEVKVVKSKRLMEYAKIVSSDKIGSCPHNDCLEPHPTINVDKGNSLKFFIERVTSFGKVEREEIYNHVILDILRRVSDETLNKIGWVERNRPQNLILEAIKIIPNTARPYIKRQAGARINSSDDITTLTKQLIEINLTLPKIIPDIPNIQLKLQNLYNILDMTYHQMVKGPVSADAQMTGASNKTPKSISGRLNNKEGRIRRNLLGKRTHYMMRSVLTCDPTLRVDEVGLPITIARNMDIPEVVSRENFERLSIYFRNKHNIYPGCTHIWKKSRGEKYIVDKVKE